MACFCVRLQTYHTRMYILFNKIENLHTSEKKTDKWNKIDHDYGTKILDGLSNFLILIICMMMFDELEPKH